MNKSTACKNAVLLAMMVGVVHITHAQDDFGSAFVDDGNGGNGAVATTGNVRKQQEWPSHQVFTLLEPRGTYFLDFDKIYETTASLDVETAITLPPGYTFALTRPGSVDFINVFVLQNTLFITRTIDHKISTSVFCNIVTPSGETKNLVLKIRGGRDEPIVQAIHFVVPEDETVTVEDGGQPQTVARSCGPEIEQALLLQERKLGDEVSVRTMSNAIPAFFAVHRGKMKTEHKGASVWVNGVIFTGGDAFVYLHSNVRRDNCDIIKLLRIEQGKNTMPADLVSTFENIDGTWSYVYRTPLQQPSKNKRSKITFVFEIWSQVLKYKAIIS